MAGGAKKHRISDQSLGRDQALAEEREPDPSAGSAPARPERRRREDRRDPRRAHLYAGVERRSGPRRTAELPSAPWQRRVGVVLAAGLGVVAALMLGAPRSATELLLAGIPAAALVDPQELAAIQALRDEAEALTPAEVSLDERAAERWAPRVPMIELARDDPHTPEAIRVELDATVAALERVGLLSPP
ncbi:hypothetical protein G6O69_02140 [Pseudenhygromyxa sp. WMMC2535]|uniref:hypothetical protein n=1 Tax=Pseudenhygromyxa sp. WMMC2535 TaxID=2712867 RepID=UPI001552AABA|nr:hypothetical protein [Pseudenhygromyxa sp. WMMC2535]NVB36615.1 hypothetical protein [Pseudenhygromyxa sp. WMMC2535]